MKARHCIHDEQKDGRSVRGKIEEVGKVATGVLTKAGSRAKLTTKKADMLALYIKWKGENRA